MTINRKGRPSKVSKEQIVACALSIGFQRLTMQTLAKQLDVSPTALYRHIGSKNELMMLCSDSVLKQVPLPTTHKWDLYLYSFAKNFREKLLSIPGSVEYVSFCNRRTQTQRELLNHSFGILKEAGFAQDVAFIVFINVYDYVIDKVRAQEANYICEKISNQNLQEEHIKDQNFPDLSWALAKMLPREVEHNNLIFECGLNIILKGMNVIYDSCLVPPPYVWSGK